MGIPIEAWDGQYLGDAGPSEVRRMIRKKQGLPMPNGAFRLFPLATDSTPERVAAVERAAEPVWREIERLLHAEQSRRDDWRQRRRAAVEKILKNRQLEPKTPDWRHWMEPGMVELLAISRPHPD